MFFWRELLRSLLKEPGSLFFFNPNWELHAYKTFNSFGKDTAAFSVLRDSMFVLNDYCSMPPSNMYVNLSFKSHPS